MTIKKHNKHPLINRPKWGKFGRNEIGVLGAPCNVIEQWVTELVKSLSRKYGITYFDADHKGKPSPEMGRLTDQISHHTMIFDTHLNDYDIKLKMRDQDLVIVNSNHFLSQRQIVFCTEKKKESLSRKLDRLTQVDLIVLDRGIDEPFTFLDDVIHSCTEVIRIDEINKAKVYVEAIVCPHQEVKGLILAGGKSTRMGKDKGQLDYHGYSQVEYLRSIFSKLHLSSFVSCRSDQLEQYGELGLPDSFLNMGPYGAILSAFKKEPDVAWLACACDIPLLGASHIKMLLESRNRSKVATSFYNPETKWPEPLITIWEPRAYGRMLEFMSLGYNCPRKVLINSDIEMIRLDDTAFMDNANTPEDFQRIKSQL